MEVGELKELSYQRGRKRKEGYFASREFEINVRGRDILLSNCETINNFPYVVTDNIHNLFNSTIIART